MLWVAANNQITINPKGGKNAFSAIPIRVLVKHKSWKAMMDVGRDPREGIFPPLGLIVSRLLAVTPIAMHFLAKLYNGYQNRGWIASELEELCLSL